MRATAGGDRNGCAAAAQQARRRLRSWEQLDSWTKEPVRVFSATVYTVSIPVSRILPAYTPDCAVLTRMYPLIVRE